MGCRGCSLLAADYKQGSMRNSGKAAHKTAKYPYKEREQRGPSHHLSAEARHQHVALLCDGHGHAEAISGHGVVGEQLRLRQRGGGGRGR